MQIDGQKIQDLIAHYGKLHNVPEKSYLVRFTDDFQLNYKQWSAYTRGDQNLGIKIIDQLMDIFPELNLNWFLKDIGDMFIVKNYAEKEAELQIASDVEITKITNEMLMEKLELMHYDIQNSYSK